MENLDSVFNTIFKYTTTKKKGNAIGKKENANEQVEQKVNLAEQNVPEEEATPRRRGRPRGTASKRRSKPKNHQNPPELLPKGTNTATDIILKIEIDAEWFTKEFNGTPPVARPPIFITLQVAQSKGESKLRRIFQHPQFNQFTSQADQEGVFHVDPSTQPLPVTGLRPQLAPGTWKGETPLPDLLGQCFSERQPREDEKIDHYPKLRLITTIYYTFADIIAFLGLRLSKVLIEQLYAGKSIRLPGRWAPLPHVISEKRSDGSVVDRQLVIEIRDLFGIEYESLQSTAAAYNVPMPHKDLMDDYKDRMHLAYTDPTMRDKMIQYALGDLVLAELWEAYQHNYSKLCEIFNVTPKLPPPNTKGALVAHLFQLVLNSTVKLPGDFHDIFDIRRPHERYSPLKDVTPPSISHLLKGYGCKSLAKSE